MAITAKHSPNLSSPECLEDICAYMQQHKKIATVLVTFDTDTNLADVFHRIERHYTHTHGLPLSNMPEDERHLLSAFVCTGCYYMIREWLLRDMDRSPKEIAALAYRFFSVAHSIGGSRQ